MRPQQLLPVQVDKTDPDGPIAVAFSVRQRPIFLSFSPLATFVRSITRTGLVAGLWCGPVTPSLGQVCSSLFYRQQVLVMLLLNVKI